MEVGKKQFSAMKNRLFFRQLTCVVAISSAILAGSTALGGEQMPDFERMDVNSTSNTYNQMVSPRDYEGKVSGWYFGHAT